MKYYLIAGEASGDLHASRLIRELALSDPQAEFRYYGGDKMQAEGGTLVCHYASLAYMGFVQVIAHLPQILSGMRRCKQDIAQWNPDVVILVDYPGFNLSIAKWVKKHLRAKVVYYISPKIWAWKEYRIRDIRKYVDCMLSILPFEVDYYRRHQYKVNYVGNPTVDELYPIAHRAFDRAAFLASCQLDPTKPVIAVLAGSRKAEVSGNLPIMLAVVDAFPEHQFVIAGAPGLTPEFYQPFVQVHPRVKVVFGQTYSVLQSAESAIVTSGTATLETAYLRVPQVVCYQFKGGKLVYNIMKFMLRKIRYVSLVNLLLDAPAVRELLGPYMTPACIETELKAIAPGTEGRRTMLAEYDRMIQILGEPGAPERAARAVRDLVN